jgi:hypothetical protein
LSGGLNRAKLLKNIEVNLGTKQPSDAKSIEWRDGLVERLSYATVDGFQLNGFHLLQEAYFQPVQTLIFECAFLALLLENQFVLFRGKGLWDCHIVLAIILQFSRASLETVDRDVKG